MTTGKKIKEALKAQGVTQKQLSERIHYSRKEVSKACNDKKVHARLLSAVENALNIELL